MTWQLVAALAVPVLGFFGSLLTSNRDPGEYRRLKHAADALGAVPTGSAAFASLEKLVVVQADALRDREAARSKRKLNVPNLVLSIILGIAGACGAFFLWSWSTSTWGSVLGWVVTPVSVVGGLVIALLVGAAFATIYNPPNKGQSDVAR